MSAEHKAQEVESAFFSLCDAAFGQENTDKSSKELYKSPKELYNAMIELGQALGKIHPLIGGGSDDSEEKVFGALATLMTSAVLSRKTDIETNTTSPSRLYLAQRESALNVARGIMLQ